MQHDLKLIDMEWYSSSLSKKTQGSNLLAYWVLSVCMFSKGLHGFPHTVQKHCP